MNPTFSRSLRVLCPVAVLAAVSLTVPLARPEANANQVNDLTGSWLFTLTSIQPGPGQFLALGTYTKEGTFIGTAQGDGICCPTEGPAHGVWMKTGSNSFAVSFYTLMHNANGSLYGIFKVTLALVLDANSNKLAGTWQAHTFDPGGNEIPPVFGGTLTASRITIP